MTYGEEQAYTLPEDKQRLQPGNYTAKFDGHELITSRVKGTPGIRLWFSLDSGKLVPVEIWITEASAPIAMEQLAKVGWNGKFDGCEFNAPPTVDLYMKFEEYKGKSRERWNISQYDKAPPPNPTDSALVRFSTLFKQQYGNNSSMPSGAPQSPAKPAKVSSPVKPAKPAPPSRKDKEYRTMDEAWGFWVQTNEGNDGEPTNTDFWKAVEEVCGHDNAEEVTPDEWNKIAGKAIPF